MLTTLGRIRSATLAKSGEPAGAGATAAVAGAAAAAGAGSALGAAARADWQASASAPGAAKAYGRMDMNELLLRALKGPGGRGLDVCGATASRRLLQHPACQPRVGLVRQWKYPCKSGSSSCGCPPRAGAARPATTGVGF